MTDPWAPVRLAYDTVAENYAELVRNDAVETRLNLAMVDDFAARVAGRGRVLDAGCGPGRMTRYLVDRGVAATGLDLSPDMVRVADRLHPDLTFSVGSLDSLPVPTGSLVGVLAWYSIIHTPPANLPDVVDELLRVLEPGGWVLMGFQSGVGERLIAHAYGHDLGLVAQLYTAEEVAGVVEEQGGVIHARLTRGRKRGRGCRRPSCSRSGYRPSIVSRSVTRPPLTCLGRPSMLNSACCA